MLQKSRAERLTDATSFLWATGIEDTFITAPWPKTGRTLDEYELTGHYKHWESDLRCMAELGVTAARYGIPWHAVQPSEKEWDWSFPDRALETLLQRGIEPIVDLVHYGVPRWIENAFLNPRFPELMAGYASRLAERFRGRIHCYTPLNEPRITAWYCGKIGWWPPFRKGWSGFVAVMLAVCRGIVQAVRALERVDPEILAAHVDATDLYETSDADLAAEAKRRQEIVFLALDLVSGRVVPEHPLHDWLIRHGAGAETLEWFRANAIDLPLVGINLYPMFSQKILSASARGVRIRMPYASAEIVLKLSRLYCERYRRPVFIAETASVGSIKRRAAWMESSIAAVRHARSEGVPVVGYTWWPMLALVTWAYRQGTRAPSAYLKQMGLWDLREGSNGELERIPTPLVDQYKRFVGGQCQAVGELKAA